MGEQEAPRRGGRKRRDDESIPIDETDVQIAFAKFNGLTQLEIGKALTPKMSPASVRQRLKLKKAFYERIVRWAASVKAIYHAVPGEDVAEDAWLDEIALRDQAIEAEISRRMLPAGRA